METMRARWQFVWVASVLAACEPRGEVLDGGPPERPAAHPPERPERPSRPKRAEPTATAVPTVVARPTFAEARNDAVAKRLPEAAREELGRSPVPALVVDEPKLLASAVITTGPHWYALSARDGGLTVSLHGTRLAHQHREIPAAKGRDAVRGRPAFFTENEGVVSASWVEDGVAYALDLECHERDDARCRGTAHLAKIAEQLVFVGGALTAGGAP